MKLPELLAELDTFEGHVPIEALCARLDVLDLDLDEIRPCIQFAPDRYQRNVLHLGPGYVAIIMCWSPGQGSPIHNHKGSACAVRVLSGTAHETVFKRGSDGMIIPGETRVYSPDSVCGSYDDDIHTIDNRQQREHLITLHVYTPPLQNIDVYRLDSPNVETWTDQETLDAMAERNSLGICVAEDCDTDS